MRQYGSFEAKTHFSEIMKLVAQGEKCIINKHGIKVAMLIPYSPEEALCPAEEAVRAIRANAKGVTLGKFSVKKLRAEGRR